MYYPNCHLGCFVVFDFFPRAMNCLFCCVYAVVGIWTMLEWNEGGILDKPGVFGAT